MTKAPAQRAEQVITLQDILVARACGRSHPREHNYEQLRGDLLKDPEVEALLPQLVKEARTLSKFWASIKERFTTYDERRQFIWDEFRPLLDHLEFASIAPSKGRSAAEFTRLIELATTLQDVMVARAEGKQHQRAFEYEKIRTALARDPETSSRLPPFAKASRSLEQFWAFIKAELPTYRLRREYLWAEFAGLLNHLEAQVEIANAGRGEPAIQPESPQPVHTPAANRPTATNRPQEPARTISEVTRRNIFEWIEQQGIHWSGRIGDLEFLSRLYDLRKLPSSDRRFPTAEGDIIQHTVRNEQDWQGGWVFWDSRFGLLDGPDQVLLSFLALMLHPIVRAKDHATRIAAVLNTHLAPDGWELRVTGAISDHPVYEPHPLQAAAPRPNTGGNGPTVDTNVEQAVPAARPIPKARSKPNSRPLRILHISDLHERAAFDGMPTSRKAKLEWDARERGLILSTRFYDSLRDIGNGGVDLVCFTGDVVDWGRPEEYLRATQRLKKILAAVGVAPDKLVVVPGNHDVQRKVQKAAWKRIRAWHQQTRDAAVLGRWLAGLGKAPGLGDKTRAQVLERSVAFWRWTKDFGCPDIVPSKSMPLGYRHLFPVGTWSNIDVPVHIVGLDSAWLCGDDNDHGKILVTEEQVLAHTSEGERALDGLRIALVHHPLDQLADQGQVWSLLADRRADLLLHGHQHTPLATRTSVPGASLNSLAAGCLVEGDLGRGWPNGFQLIEIDVASKRQTIHLRKWARNATPRFWTKGSDIYKDAPDGVLVWPPNDAPTPRQPPSQGTDQASSQGGAGLESLAEHNLARPDSEPPNEGGYPYSPDRPATMVECNRCRSNVPEDEVVIRVVRLPRRGISGHTSRRVCQTCARDLDEGIGW